MPDSLDDVYVYPGNPPGYFPYNPNPPPGLIGGFENVGEWNTPPPPQNPSSGLVFTPHPTAPPEQPGAPPTQQLDDVVITARPSIWQRIAGFFMRGRDQVAPSDLAEKLILFGELGALGATPLRVPKRIPKVRPRRTAPKPAPTRRERPRRQPDPSVRPPPPPVIVPAPRPAPQPSQPARRALPAVSPPAAPPRRALPSPGPALQPPPASPGTTPPRPAPGPSAPTTWPGLAPVFAPPAQPGPTPRHSAAPSPVARSAPALALSSLPSPLALFQAVPALQPNLALAPAPALAPAIVTAVTAPAPLPLSATPLRLVSSLPQRIPIIGAVDATAAQPEPQSQTACKCPPKKKGKKKKPRTKCFKGSYRERAKGLFKSPREEIPCQ